MLWCCLWNAFEQIVGKKNSLPTSAIFTSWRWTEYLERCFCFAFIEMQKRFDSGEATLPSQKHLNGKFQSILQKLLHKVTSYLSSFEKLYFGNLQCADNWHFSKELLRNLHFWYSIIRCWNFKFVNASCHIAMFCEQRVNLKATQICKVYFPKADLQDLQCQVRQWFIVSDLEIAITSSSFASLLKWHETAKVLVLQKQTHFLKWISPEL